MNRAESDKLIERLLDHKRETEDSHLIMVLFPGTKSGHLWVLVDHADNWIAERLAWLIDVDEWISGNWTFNKVMECRSHVPQKPEPVISILGTSCVNTILRWLPYPEGKGPKYGIDYEYNGKRFNTVTGPIEEKKQ